MDQGFAVVVGASTAADNDLVAATDSDPVAADGGQGGAVEGSQGTAEASGDHGIGAARIGVDAGLAAGLGDDTALGLVLSAWLEEG
jgi:hypothetical protein